MKIDNISSAQICTMKELNNLFIELTEKNCNQHCKHCYIDFPTTKNIKDFIPIEKVRQSLKDTLQEKIKCIYLTGAEPMTHPDFNNILRLCLTRTNVCICTNGSFINEKKARFLKKVEDESDFSIVFQLPIDHYNEVKSDDIRGRGSYRQIIHAIKNLAKYDFYVILCITNYHKEDKKVLLQEFTKTIQNFGFSSNIVSFKINEYYDKLNLSNDFALTYKNLDCENSRILTNRGVYVCSFLANDYRGRMGNDFTDYGTKMHLDTSFCSTCMKNNEQMFALDTKLFDD